MRFHKTLTILAAAYCALAQEKPSLPEAPGKAELQKVCVACHELETVVASRRTRIGWQRMVEDMTARGAEGSEEELAAVVSYLTAYFGKVNVNTATAQEIEKALEIPGNEAEAIVGYRDRNGKLKSFEELIKVPGVSAERLQAKRGLIAFSL